MPTLLNDFPEAITPTPEEVTLAKESSRQVARFVGANPPKGVRLRILADDTAEETVAIPAVAFRLLNDILTEMAKGNALTLMPIHAELTTQQAADILNVSRPFLIEQLKNQKIPFRMVGTHRRILFADLMKYKETIDRDRMKTLEELAAQAQELDMGY